MKVPNAESIAKIKLEEPVIPTFVEETRGCSIILEMIDDSIAEYQNEGYMELKEKLPSIKEAAKQWMSGDLEDFYSMYTPHPEYTKIIKKHFPNVKQVYIGSL